MLKDRLEDEENRKNIYDLHGKRDELHKQILQEEGEKQKLQSDIRILRERLDIVKESLSKKMASRNNFDKTIAETESEVMKILESSKTLLRNLTPNSEGEINSRSTSGPVVMSL